eukprot:Opistho-2@6700
MFRCVLDLAFVKQTIALQYIFRMSNTTIGKQPLHAFGTKHSSFGFLIAANTCTFIFDQRGLMASMILWARRLSAFVLTLTVYFTTTGSHFSPSMRKTFTANKTVVKSDLIREVAPRSRTYHRSLWDHRYRGLQVLEAVAMSSGVCA